MTPDDPTRKRHRSDNEKEPERGSHNEIGYRNVDEDVTHDERGSQGPGAGEPDAREE